ncbi:MAG: hypothetical protein IJ164_05045 [Duodenibacillus sp.]|nr:hypothetical protein [Duodenibacillus sp.]
MLGKMMDQPTFFPEHPFRKRGKAALLRVDGAGGGTLSSWNKKNLPYDIRLAGEAATRL